MTRERCRFLWTHVAAERRLGMLFANEATRGGGEELGLPSTDEAMGRSRRSLPLWT